MSDVLIEETSLKRLADAIRTVNRSVDTYTAIEMAQAVLDLIGNRFERQVFLNILSRTTASDEALNLEYATEIGDCAFIEERKLKRIYADNVLTVGRGAFAFCSMYYYNNTWNCYNYSSRTDISSLEEVSLEKCTQLGYAAFAFNKGIKKVNIPAVSTIPTNCFYNCINLETISENIHAVDLYGFAGCIKLISIPENIEVIGNYGFENCTGLLDTKLPDSLTTIGNYAFYGCSNLAISKISSSVTYIGSYVFQNCNNIKHLTIDMGSGSTLSGYAFYNCDGLEDLVIKYIRFGSGSSYHFASCDNLITVDYSQDTEQTSVASNMFRDCVKLEQFVFPPNLLTIADYAFYNCQMLGKVELPDTITGIGTYAFYNCYMLKIDYLPRDLITINSASFYNCRQLKDLVFNDKLKTIGSNAFYGCIGLHSIDIPASVTTLNSYAFQNCTGLRCVLFHARPSSIISSSIFSNCSGITDIYVPWAEGTVSYAPWGATNATVHYNTTEEDIERLYTVTDFDVTAQNIICWYEGSELFITPTFNSLCSKNNMGIQWTLPSGVTIEDDMLRLTNDITVGTKLSITATPENNPELAKSFEVITIDPSYVIDGTTVAFAHSTGVTIESSDIDEYGVADIHAYESSAGYEGFNILLSNLDPGRLYELHFDFQVTQGSFITDYSLDYKVYDDLRSDYNNYNLYWENKIERDYQKRHHVFKFIPSGTTAYLSFNLTAFSDSTQNHFDITNLFAYKPDIIPLVNDVATQSSALVLYYDALLNGSDTTKLIDLSGNNNDGYPHGVVFNADNFGFTGSSSSYVDCGDIQNALSSFEVYCKPNSSSNYLIFNNLEYGGWYFGIYNYQPLVGYYINGGERYFYYNGPRVTSTKFTHFVGTFDGNSIKLYVNGELGQTLNYTGRIAPTRYNTHLILGGNAYQYYSNGNYYNGLIRTARVYARALTAEEVMAHYEYDYNRYENI